MLYTLSGTELCDRNLLCRGAYDLLVRSGNAKLPIEPMKILHSLGNFELFSLDNLALSLADRNYKSVYELWGKYGAIYYDSDSDKYTLFINMKNSAFMVSYTVILAATYIELQFAQKDDIVTLSDDNNSVYIFANCLLAPDIVLSACDCNDNGDIMQLTNLPLHSSLIKERQLHRKTFGNTPIPSAAIEQILLSRYHNFIKNHK